MSYLFFLEFKNKINWVLETKENWCCKNWVLVNLDPSIDYVLVKVECWKVAGKLKWNWVASVSNVEYLLSN